MTERAVPPESAEPAEPAEPPEPPEPPEPADPSDERDDRPLGLFRRLLRSGRAPRSPQSCEHLRDAPSGVEPATPGRCADHRPEDGPVVHLRMCLTCGHVACCDSSPPRHATRHYEATGHPVMQSHEPGEDWRWCYRDELLG